MRVGLQPDASMDYARVLMFDRVMNTYTEFTNSPQMITEVQERIGNDEVPTFKVEIISNTDLLEITVRDQDPELARTTANVVADILSELRITHEVRIAVASPATQAVGRGKLDNALYVISGLLLGLSTGVGLAFLLEMIDERLYTPNQIEEFTNLPILGRIPVLQKRNKNIKSQSDLRDFEREAFHRLRARMVAFADNQKLGTVLVVSPRPGDGKSTVTTCLGMAFAEVGQKVVLIDADDRRPNLYYLIEEVDNIFGLLSVLAGNINLKNAIKTTNIKGLNLLTSGVMDSYLFSASLFEPSRLEAIFNQLSECYDIVLVDTPAMLAVVNASLLMPIAENILIIAEPGDARQTDIKAILDEIAPFNHRLVGIVVNRLSRRNSYFPYVDQKNKQNTSKV